MTGLSRLGLTDGATRRSAIPMTGTEIQHADGRVELDEAAAAVIQRSALYNHDLAPVRVKDRTWSTYNFAALWVSMAHCIPTYMLAAGLIGAGMSWGQALFTIALGNVIVLAPILANSHPGTKYGIPFPVFARAAYGTVGANLPALLRALVACGWFGINAWIGGKALHTFFRALWPAWETMGGKLGDYPLGLWIAFGLFWALNIFIVYRGMDVLRLVENWAAPFVLVMTGLLLAWAVWKADGLGQIMSQPGKFDSPAAFMKVFIPSLTAMIGFWATLSLNMPDFTRFGRSQREQMVGQVVALPSTMTVFAAMAVVITSASAVIFGEAIWDPVVLVGKFTQTWIVAISMFTIVVATLAVNIAANVVSPANDFANAFPRHIDFPRGGLITGVIGILMMPWKLAEDPSGYIYKWLLGYSGGLGAIAGVLIADYYVVRRKELKLADLYLEGGAYRYQAGWNLPATVATLLGCAVAWAGFVLPQLARLSDYAWFVGFGLSAVAYLGLMRRRPA
jgi:nucleobase:cation symporter-1, NCS1 family